MAYNNFLNKIKQWDNRAAQWMNRHFYTILFEAILAIIFLFALFNGQKIIYTGFEIPKTDTAGQLLLAQSFNSLLVVMLLLLISLGVLNIINANMRLRGSLKNIEFLLSRRRSDPKSTEE